MAHVVVLESVNQDIFVCGFCKTVFNLLELFLDHKSKSCNTGFEDQRLNSAKISNVKDENIPFIPSERYAQKTETADESLSCKLCRKKFKKAKCLLAHSKVHCLKPYQCPVCGRCFIQNSHLQRHILSHKVWPDGLSETTPKCSDVDLLSYACSYCELVLSNYSQFRAHLKNHLDLKKFKCIQDCKSLFDKVENLLEHVSSMHSTHTYTCHMCCNTFESLESIAQHHQESHFESIEQIKPFKTKQYKCSQCDAVFRKQEKLSLHMLTENHKKNCIHCHKMFVSDKRLRMHLQIHRKSKPFQCHICNESFHLKKYLTSHLLRHGNRQFKCSVCKYMFKRQDLLQRHMRLHQIKKMYQCPFKETLNCSREFSRSDKLKLHIKCHTKRVALQNNIQSKSKDSITVKREVTKRSKKHSQ